jgi:hypothetical protein
VVSNLFMWLLLTQYDNPIFQEESSSRPKVYQSPIWLDGGAGEIDDGVGSHMWSLVLDKKVEIEDVT